MECFLGSVRVSFTQCLYKVEAETHPEGLVVLFLRIQLVEGFVNGCQVLRLNGDEVGLDESKEVRVSGNGHHPRVINLCADNMEQIIDQQWTLREVEAHSLQG